jgi:hypothetical protein
MIFDRPQKQADTATIPLSHGVVAHIGTHLLDGPKRPVNCWTYISQGLEQFGQKEIFFAIDIPAAEAPQGPVKLLDAVANLASQGQLVDVGGFTEFGPTVAAALARRSKLAIRGIGYAQAHGIDRVVAPFGAVSKDFLTAMLLSSDELEIGRKCGLPRVLTQLSKISRVFPYAVWNDPKRQSLSAALLLSSSQLGHFGGTVSVQGVMPFREEGEVKLRIPALVMPELGNLLAACSQKNVGLLLPTTDGWGEAAACMAWNPASKIPEAISSRVSKDSLTHFDEPHQRLLGCFIGFAVASQDEGAIMLEDGFIVLVNKEHAEQLSHALSAGNSFELEGSGTMMDFALIPVRNVKM